MKIEKRGLPVKMRLLSLVLALCLCAFALPSLAAGAEPVREKMKYTIMSPDLPDLIGTDDRVTAALMEKFNLELEFISPPWGEQNTKLQLMMASGSVPDLFATDGTGNADHDKWVRDGLIMDITDIAQNYPNIQALLSDPGFAAWKSDNDRWFCIPKFYDSAAPHGIYVRKDWLDKLGMAVPKTTDEFQAMLKAFVEADPERKQNIGLSVDSIWWAGNYLAPSFTGIAYNGWGLVDGQYTRAEVAPGYKDFLKYMNGLYAQGLVGSDMLVGQNGSGIEKFVAGSAGATIYNVDASIYNQNMDGLLQNYPEAEAYVIDALQGPAGRFHPAGGLDAMTAAAFNAKLQNPERLFEFVDYLLSDEGKQMMRYGIEGVHYTMDGDKIVVNQAEIDADKQRSGDIVWSLGEHILHTVASYDYTRWLPQSTKRYDELNDIMTRIHENLIRTDVVGYSSENSIIIMPKVQDIIDEYTVQFISGKLDIDAGWDQYIQEIHDAGYATLVDEITEYMK